MRAAAILLMGLCLSAWATFAGAQVRDIPSPRISQPSSPPSIVRPQAPTDLRRYETLVPIAPPPVTITEVRSVEAGKIHYPGAVLESTKVQVRFRGLPPGARVRALPGSGAAFSAVRDLSRQSGPTPCGGTAYAWALNSEVNPASMATVDGQGLATLTYMTSLAIASGGAAQAQGPCSIVLGLEIRTSSAAEVQTLALRSPVFQPVLIKRYRYDDTWPLRRIFNFTMLSQALGSTCDGTSVGPVQSHPVGPTERNGDLLIQIRSGPLGTACRAVSPGVALSDQIKLVEIDWAIEYTGDKCCAGGDCGESAVFLPGHIPDDAPARYQDLAPQTGMSGEVRYPRLNPGQWVVGQAHVALKCQMAGMNDHGVRVVLRSATFEGPPDADLP